jgi:membrane fusion protein, heavy metal efflux system
MSSSSLHRVSGAILGLLLLMSPVAVLAHAGHGNEFENKSTTEETSKSIEIDPETAKLMGIIVEPATKKRVDIGLKTTGQIETLPSQQVEVTTPVEGAKVIELLVEPGDIVKLGQPIAVLYSPQLVELRVDSQEKRVEAKGDLQQAQADLTSAQQNYEKLSQIANDEIIQARSQLSFAKEKYEKDRELAINGALPRRTALESETEYKEAQTDLTRALSRRDVIDAEAQLKRTQAAVEVATSRLKLSDSIYQTRLTQLEARANEKGLVTVNAPIAGRVVDREVTLGQTFQDAGSRLMSIANDDRVYATANIYEKDLNKIEIGQKITLKVASVPDRTFSGRITTIGTAVERETRVVPVKAQIDNPEGILKQGMFAELEVLTNQGAVEVMTIPSTAVVTANGKQQVYVQSGNTFLPVAVVLGEVYGDAIEVRSGLFEGDRVVTQRAPQLYAQSLRGGGDNAEKEAKTAELSQNYSPSWWLLAGGGLIFGVSAFTVGVLAGRRSRRIPQIKDSERMETEASLDNLERLGLVAQRFEELERKNHD